MTPMNKTLIVDQNNHLLGDRPMSEGGKGKPVDDLDVTCQHYKQCQKCARMTHGEVCNERLVNFIIYFNLRSALVKWSSMSGRKSPAHTI